MKPLAAIFIAAFFVSAVAFGQDSPTYTASSIPVTAQDRARDTVRLSGAYLDSKIPLINRGLGIEQDEAVRGFSFDADVKFIRAGNLRGSLAYNFQQLNDVEVYPNYFDGMMVVDLYRNVRTHYGGLQLGYTLAGAVEPFGGFFVGTRRVHEDANRITVRKWRFGVNVPFHEKSPFFVRGFIEFEKPYGTLNSGFISPGARHIGLGAGFRF